MPHRFLAVLLKDALQSAFDAIGKGITASAIFLQTMNFAGLDINYLLTGVMTILGIIYMAYKANNERLTNRLKKLEIKSKEREAIREQAEQGQ
jgi:uncharacterized membrane protein YciS (DUF1049 family)